MGSNNFNTTTTVVGESSSSNSTTMYDNIDNFPNYNDIQKIIIGYIPMVTSPLSIIGSSIVIYVIYKETLRKTSSDNNNNNTNTNNIFHRLMLGMSCIDLLSSIPMLLLGPWVMPSNEYYNDINYSNPTIGAYGNFTTCEIAGFFINIFFGTLYYNAAFAIYFVCTIRYEIKKETLVKYFEPIAHILAISIPLITGIIGIVNNLFNPLVVLPGFCWFENFPHNCNDIDKANVECIRGNNVYIGAIVFSTITFIIIWLIIIISMILLIMKVYETENRMRQYASGTNNYQHTKQTSIQAILYIVAFFITFGPITILQIVSDTNNESSNIIFTFALLTKFFTPMQGLWNAIIYLRTRIHTLTAKNHCLEFLAPLINYFIKNRHPSRLHTTTTTNNNNGQVIIEQQTTTTTTNQFNNTLTESPTITENNVDC